MMPINTVPTMHRFVCRSNPCEANLGENARSCVILVWLYLYRWYIQHAAQRCGGGTEGGGWIQTNL